MNATNNTSPNHRTIKIRTMDICEYHLWLKAIKCNNASKIKEQLENVDKITRAKLLNEPFHWKNPSNQIFLSRSGKDLSKVFKISYPWTIAAAYSSLDVMDVFLQYDINVLVRDDYGNNVVHILCYLALENEEEKVEGVYNFLLKTLKCDKLRALLFQENISGLRPLELSSALGVFSMFMSIFQTKGVYITHEVTDGLITEQWFDITEYESPILGKRELLSPVFLWKMLDKSRLECPSTKRCFTSECIKMWTEARIRCCTIPLIAWLLFRLLHGFCFYYVQMYVVSNEERSFLENIKAERKEYGNITETCIMRSVEQQLPVNNIMFYLCLAVTLFTSTQWIFKWLWRFVQFKRKKYLYRMQMPRRRKKLQVQIGFLVLTEGFLYCGTLVYMISILFKYEGDYHIPRILEEIAVHFVFTGIFMTFLEMMQVFAASALFLVGFEMILEVFIRFMFDIFILMAPYAYTLYRIVNLDQVECFEGRQSALSYFYVVFKTIFNLVNYEYLAEHVDTDELKTCLYIFHFMVVCMFAICLINYLIASAGNSVSFVWKNQQVIATIQQLHMISTVVESGWLHSCYGWWYRIAKPWFFSTQGDRIYVTQVLVAGNHYGND